MTGARRDPAPRRPAAMALAFVALALLGLGCSGDDDAVEGDAADGPATATTSEPVPTVYDLEVGDCFNGLDAERDLRIRVVDCDEPHQAEVYARLDLDDRRFPGVAVLRRQAATRCAQGFAGYTGEPSGPGTELAFTEIVPSLESFTAGDRRALCVALGLDDERLTGSIAQGGSA